MTAGYSGPSLRTHTDRLLSTAPETQWGWKDVADCYKRRFFKLEFQILFVYTFLMVQMFTWFWRAGIINFLKISFESDVDSCSATKGIFQVLRHSYYTSRSNEPIFGGGVFQGFGGRGQISIKRTFRKSKHWGFHGLKQTHIMLTMGNCTRLTFVSLQSFKGSWSNLIILIFPGVIRITCRLLGHPVRN